MHHELVRSFLMFRPFGEPIVVHEWQNYHRAFRPNAGGSTRWVKNIGTKLSTADGLEVQARETDRDLWIPKTGEILSWPEGAG